MAAYVSSLKFQKELGTQRTNIVTDNGASTGVPHSVARPFLVIQKVSVPEKATGTARFTMDIVRGDVDADGNPLDAKSGISIVARRPLNGNADSLSDCYSTALDLFSSDEFIASLSNFLFLDVNHA